MNAKETYDTVSKLLREFTRRGVDLKEAPQQLNLRNEQNTLKAKLSHKLFTAHLMKEQQNFPATVCFAREKPTIDTSALERDRRPVGKCRCRPHNAALLEPFAKTQKVQESERAHSLVLY